MNLNQIVNTKKYLLADESYQASCKQKLDCGGVLVLQDFLLPNTVKLLKQEGGDNQHLAYYTNSKHNVYLASFDTTFAPEHARNKMVVSSKGCITTDQIPPNSLLHLLYESQEFKNFLCTVLGESALYEYSDKLSSINLHYASEGQELGWHFDNSSFAITLLIQKPEVGGVFEYVTNIRDADAGEMGYELVGKILNGEETPEILPVQEGALVLFHGRNSIHRVSPTIGKRTRMLAVLAYNSEPNISLSESARMTFYGRLG